MAASRPVTSLYLYVKVFYYYYYGDETESNDDRVAISKKYDTEEDAQSDDLPALPDSLESERKSDVLMESGEDDAVEILTDREEQDVEYDRVIPLSEDESVRLQKNKNKCIVCRKSFKSKRLLKTHMRKHPKIKNKYKCYNCTKEFKSSYGLAQHVERKHNFVCKTCEASFESQEELMEHISIDHPKCKVCNKRFSCRVRYLNHYQAVHQDEEEEESEPDSDLPPASEDEMSDEEDPRAETKREDKMFHKHINCVTIERFLKIRQFIANNQFDSLVNDEQLMEALLIILKGVVKGFIPICTTQRIILTKEMKKLMYSFVRRPSSTKILRNKHNLKMLFDVIWTSVKVVIDSFLQYDA